jgi:Lecithin retinol acyltransferase
VFELGTHIKAQRRLTIAGVDTGLRYWHHGIVIGNGDVVDFGGGDPMHKAATQVRPVTLEAFRSGCEAEVVNHPVTHSGITYSEPLPPEEVVDRSLWLCVNQPPAYRLGYRNCESIAIWCATGDFESFQVKRFLGWKARLVTPVIAAALRWRPRIGAPLAVGSMLVSLWTAVPYIHSRAFFDHTRAYPGLGRWQSPHASLEPASKINPSSSPRKTSSLKEGELEVAEAIRCADHGLTSANDYGVSQVISCVTSSDSRA